VSRPSKNKRTRWANVVLPYLPMAPDAPISVAELVAKTGLRTQEIHHGVGMLRDEMVKDGGRPLVSGPDGYRFTFDESDVAEFRSRQTRRAYTTMRRLWNGVLRPYLATLPPGSKEAKEAAKQMGRALEDLGELVTVNGRA
jgi:hypothetical protein